MILKLHGGVDPGPERAWESFVVTEDDYIDYLPQSELAAAVPVGLAARLRRSHFLFLGYGMRDWNLRLVLNRLWGGAPAQLPLLGGRAAAGARRARSSGARATSTSSRRRSRSTSAVARAARRRRSRRRAMTVTPASRRRARTRASPRSRTPSSTRCSSSAASATPR